LQSLTLKKDIQQVNENTDSFMNFVAKFRNSPMTRIAYTEGLKRYLEYCNLPEVRARLGILTDIINSNTDFLLFDNDAKKIQGIIKRFIDYLYNVRKLSPSSVRGYYMAVKHFYISNEIALNWPIIKDYVGIMSNVKASVDLPYTYEEIHKMLDKCNERERVIILLLCSSGMRRGGLRELKYGDLKWIEKYQLYEITVYKGYREQYVTYCSQEAATSLNSYFEFRKRHNENLTKDSYVIRKEFDTRNRQGFIKISDATDPPEKHKIALRSLESVVYRCLYRAGIRTWNERKKRVGDRHVNMAAHSFRKFFENKCLEAGIDPFFVSALMGHRSKGLGVERHYYRPETINGENSLLELFAKKASPLLTINEENRLLLKNQELELRLQKDSSRIKEAEASIKAALEKSLEEQAAKNKDIVAVLVNEMDEMRKEIAKLK
jgi:integrase